MKIAIRKSNSKDVDKIIEMLKKGFKSGKWNYPRSNKFDKKKEKRFREIYKKKNPEFYSFIAIDKEISKVIGVTNFNFKKEGRTKHRVVFGWSVLPEYQKKGISTKLLMTALGYARKKGFKRAEAEMAIKNVGSWKLAKKCGFKIEGKKKQGLLLDNGKLVDTYIVGKIL